MRRQAKWLLVCSLLARAPCGIVAPLAMLVYAVGSRLARAEVRPSARSALEGSGWCVLLLAVLVAAGQLIEAAQRPIILLAKANRAPELCLGPEQRWHLFLSHIWSTGQDQCCLLYTSPSPRD